MKNESARKTLASQIDFAWRVHAAQEAWTAKVDIKASIFLAAQVGLLVCIASLVSTHTICLTSWPQLTSIAVAISLVVLGGLFSGMAVYPRLKANVPKEYDLIYFGHLKTLRPTEVASRLQGLNAAHELESLSAQLVSMASANWLKHRLLQISIWLTGAGVLLAFVIVFSSPA